MYGHNFICDGTIMNEKKVESYALEVKKKRKIYSLIKWKLLRTELAKYLNSFSILLIFYKCLQLIFLTCVIVLEVLGFLQIKRNLYGI